MSEIKDIELKYIKEIIPNILYIKLERYNIKTIDDIESLENNEFRKLPYIGKRVDNLFSEFKTFIQNNTEEIKSIYRKNVPKSIPISFTEELNILQLIESIIEDFLLVIQDFDYISIKAKERNIRNVDVLRKCFGLKSTIYERNKIAKRHRLNRERVRQIEEKFILQLQQLINGEFIDYWNCKCKNESIVLIQSFQKEIVNKPIISEFILSKIFKDYGIEEYFINNKNYFFLLLKVWGYENVGLSRYYNLRKNNLFVDASVEKELFLNIASKIISFLEKKVIPVSFDHIAIEVLDEYEQEDDFIKLTCDVLQEIEKLENEYYQIKFEYLSSINDYAYRLLYEKQKELSYNELLLLINNRLVHIDKELEMVSLKSNLNKDDYIVPIGKTGSWTLVELNKNIDSQINLILKTFKILEKPLSVSEITEFINQEFLRNDINSRSITSNLWNYRKYFIRLTNNRYSLVETKEKYKSEIVESKVYVKKIGETISDEIARKIVEVLNNCSNKKMLLIDLVKTLSHMYGAYGNMAIYKAVSKNPLLFKKDLIDRKEKYISLIVSNAQIQNEITSKYKWDELKVILERELKTIFISNTQPTYSISLNDALDAFFKIITTEISEQNSEITDLADRILPTLYKFYVGASDRNDKLNFLKQIVASQESYLKKLLFFVSNSDYVLTKMSKSGFGTIIDYLPKIDSRKNRYQELRTATVFEFGKHCSRAYNNRNIDTHNAKKWTEAEIIETTTSCLVFMVYGAYEYYNEIKRI